MRSRRTRKRRSRPARTSPVSNSAPAAAIWIYDVPVAMDAYLARKVRAANQSGSLTQNQLDVARLILANPQHQVPRLPPLLELHIRFSYIVALFYQGFSDEGERELTVARRAISLSSLSPSREEVLTTERILSSLYSLGCVDTIDAICKEPLVRASIKTFEWSDEAKDIDALRILTTLTLCKQLTSGTEAALHFSDHEASVLRQQHGPLHFYPEHLLRTLRYTVLLRGEDGDLRREALQFFASLLTVSVEKVDETSVTMLPSLADMFYLVAQGLLRSLGSEPPGWLEALANDGLRVCAWAHSLTPDQSRKLDLYGWNLVVLDAAIGVLLALTHPDRARASIAKDGGAGIISNEYIHTLPLHRRVDAFHQCTLIYHLAGCNPIRQVRDFVQAVAEWRGACADYDVRGALRQTLAWQCGQVLGAARAWVGQATGAERSRSLLALAEAEDVLGPGRWLQERLYTAASSGRPRVERGARTRRPPYQFHGRLSTGRDQGDTGPSWTAPAGSDRPQDSAQCADGVRIDTASEAVASKVNTDDLLAKGSSGWPAIFAGDGEIWHLIAVNGDLWWIRLQVSSGEPRLRVTTTTTKHVKCVGVAKRLRELHAAFLGPDGQITNARRRASAASDQASQSAARQDLDEAVVGLSLKMTEILGGVRTIAAEVQDKDLLLVCADPRLLALPWGIAPTPAGPLMQVVRSLTINASIGAAAASAKTSTARSNDSLTDLAAYCAPGPETAGRLHWHEMFTGETGLADVLEGRVDVFGDLGSDDHVANTAAVHRYPEDGECAALLVAGHGEPRKGIRLVDDYWDPLELERSTWRLTRTECAILPSCRLGEMLWRNDAQEDPGRNEVTGFMAGMLLRGLPRVIACPWIAFDTPLCGILPSIVARAEELRRAGSPHRWSRSLRDTIIGGFGRQRPYDLANLVLFGAP